MQLKEIAEKLSGMEYGTRLDKSLVNEAKSAGIVIVYGASDDLVEFDGAACDEIGCYEGGTAYFNSKGLVYNKCDHDDCPYALEEIKKSVKIEILWCKEGCYSWTYKTEIPHETFEVVEGGEPYCRGIVFKLSDITEV